MRRESGAAIRAGLQTRVWNRQDAQNRNR